MSMTMRALFSPLGLAALLALPTLSFAAPDGSPPPTVPIITVQPAPAAVYKTYTGRTEAHRHVEVRAQVNGILEERSYVEGARVESGDPLFRIDARPYRAAVNQAEADLVAARATLSAAQRDWERIRSLYERNVASEKAWNDARSALEKAQAEVEVAQAKLEAAQIDLDYTSVDAPIAGVAGLRAVSVGNLVSNGDRLVTIQEVNPIQVILSMPVNDPFADAPALNPSPSRPIPAELADAIDSEGNPLTGKLDYRAADIDRRTNAIRLRGIFDNPGNVLRPNEYVRVRLKVAEPQDALVIPQTAITSGPRPNSTAVFVVDEEDHARLQVVELGPDTPEGVIVRSGLEAGDRVITDGLINVRPDAQVTPQQLNGEDASVD
ncbi:MULTISPECIES: efflux RND transporter periplasmic adaptor subunit [unclassified Ectothiorhodospira]|uniref:efflux RND transporter periplasmic adaptor subunit n=1 Tax=unclassified Ectothiorhodospira TaxID=2684909 RepID=UPI001EE92D4D|nr:MULTISPECIES: efflux RND transporter periplasmic adaptor subunit [unclassified Ectothiorhodospira]MCG5515588.1 efflux RND transporter periplasmic adaptor subunit [Ectothiorhodospira sp. 9100]MCG5520111.1 efflux RND transporter periplasmic adaptor subunit [Ectothiorhodospira sp. 9905]